MAVIEAYGLTTAAPRPETMIQVMLRTGATRYKLTHYMKQLAKAGKPVPCERTRGGRILSLTSTPELEAMLSGVMKGGGK